MRRLFHHRRPWHLATVASGLGAGILFSGCATPAAERATTEYVSRALQDQGANRIRPPGAPAAAELPPGVSLEDGLAEGEAVATALWNNAAFQENLARLGVARADLAQAGMLANPMLSMLFPVGPKQLEFTVTLPLETLWLRDRRIVAATQDAERVAQGLVQSGLDLARDVRVALSELHLASNRAAIARRMLLTREAISTITRNRLRLRDASELEAIAARAEVERAREESARYAREQDIGRERLSFLLGWPLPDHLSLGEPATAPAGALPDRATLETRALAARPDLRASELALEAAGRKAGLADAETFALSGILDANGSGKEGFELGPGVALPLPFFHQNQANRLRAQAELERAGWNYLGTRQRVMAEVREARARLEQATASLSVYESQVLPPYEEWERTARRAYELGEISPLVVQDNARQLLQLEMRRAELRADVRRALAELERSVGTSLKSIPRNPSASPSP